MRIFGHPIHTMLVHFPIACWSLASMCDGLALIGYTDAWNYTAPLLLVGLLVAIPAMGAGFFDLIRITDEPTGALANQHMYLMCGAWTIYLAALLTRLDQKVLIEDPALLPIILSGSGLIILAAGGWLGGQLIYHHGIGTRFQEKQKNRSPANKDN